MIARNFLDYTCDGGVNPSLDTKLTIADNLLRIAFTAQVTTGLFAGSWTDWTQIRQPHGATHDGGHSPGDAIDVNYDTCPYIAIRTPVGGSVTYAGERGGPNGIVMARVLATTVYDRAIAFFSSSSAVANASGRASAESTVDVFGRFKTISDVLQRYLGLVFNPTLPPITRPPPAGVNNPPRVNRPMVANAHKASLPQLHAGIPQSERLSEADARARIAAIVSGFAFPATHPGWDFSVDFWYRQILRDYEVVRVPMQFNAAALAPMETRNPANGFLNLREDVVTTLGGDGSVVLVNPLMRWGICDFGNESGDVQHFDLRQRIPSGAIGSTPPEVRINTGTVAGIQQGLMALGFNAGSVSGVVDGSTTSAIAAFRTANLLPPGGVDFVLQGALEIALRQAAVPL